MRKDLSYFGQFGKRGVGYKTSELNKNILKILGLDHEWNVAIVGAGNLGSALSAYRGLKEHRFIVSAVFDSDKSKAGRYCGTVRVSSMDEVKDVVAREGIEIAIIAVPAEAAQWVANQLVAAGLKAILNFAPATLVVPEDVKLRNVDLSIELENLSYFLTTKDQEAALENG
jgi:redox-sensing transcriptional repressor